MENTICVVVDFASTTAQIGFLIAKRQKVYHLQWKIEFVLLLSLSQQQHKLDFSLQNAKKYAFCDGKFHLCCC